MKNGKLSRAILTTAFLAVTVPALQGCFPVVATGVAVGVLAVTDRRTVGTQTDDEAIEWKVSNRISDRFKDVHVNVTSYNRRALITGEVPNEQVKAEIEDIVVKTDNVQGIWNELQVGPNTSFSSRSNDAFITSKVKTRFVDANQFTPTRVKVVTEAGVVYLLGLVNEAEAKSAIQVTRTTDGVRKVVNVMETLTDAEIRRIEAALSRDKKQPAVDASR